MNVSMPARVSLSAFSQIAHAQAHGLFAVSATSVAPAASAARASGAAQIHRIALHALGTGNAAASAANLSAPAFVATADKDTLGIITAYLSQDDQLVMRNVDASVRAVVDPIIHALRLSAREACILFAQPNDLSKLRELYLTNVNDKDLIDLAELLKQMPKTDFELTLELNSFHSRGSSASALISVEGLGPLLALRFSGLTLKHIPISAALSRALEHSVSPLSLTLPYHNSGEDLLDEISRIPTLRSLQIGRQCNMSSVAINALRSHEKLDRLEIYIISGEHLAILATSAHIRSLKVEFIRHGGQAAALTALAENHALTSLDLRVDDANALAVLSQNVTLQKLYLNVRQLTRSSLASIAAMPALEEFLLSGHAGLEEPICVDDIAALSARPLKSLSFRDIQMDGPMRSLLATAKTAKLRLESCTPFEREDFAALGQNRSIGSLFIWNSGRSTSFDDVLSMVTSGLPQLESLDVTVRYAEGVVPAIEAAWVASGRQLANLNLGLGVD